jgi:Fe-S cluster assembly protein SufD
VTPPIAATDPGSLPGPPALADARRRALARFEAGPLPTDADEIWRYSRVGELDPGAWTPAPSPSGPQPIPPEVAGFLARVGEHAAFALTVDGHLAVHDVGAAPLHLGVASSDLDGLTAGSEPWDAFAELNTALAPDPLVIDVASGGVIDEPVVVCHWVVSGETVTFPRVIVRVGEGAEVTVVEWHSSAGVRSWVDPVTELHVADGGHLTHLTVQELGAQVWQTAYVAASVGRDASLRSATIAVGGDYARVRTDSRVTGIGGSAELLALYCGNGTQMHDFRTLQDHAAPKSTSTLLFKGAVADEARSAYSGLIRVRRGAAGTSAFQTNRNLILSDTGLASYSVPNLDIEENDVSCSHASATGPIDPDQRFYLESRGVPPEVAERLIVLGFFAELIDRLPFPGLRAHLSDVIGTKLGVAGG